MSAPTPNSATSRQRLLRIGGAVAVTLLVVGAILAGVLTTREQDKDRRTGIVKAPHTVVQSVTGGPAPVRAETKPLVDADYPYQLEGKIVDNSASSLLNTTLPSAAGQKTADKQAAPGGAAAASPLTNVVTAVAWAAVGGGAEPSTAAICYIGTAKELVKASTAASPCVILVLTRSYSDEYEVKETMNISTTKVIVGNPVNLPHIHPKNIKRTFNGELIILPFRPITRIWLPRVFFFVSSANDWVMTMINDGSVLHRVYILSLISGIAVLDGGSLDLRSVAITRAAGESFDTPEGGSTRLIMGGTALVYPGGNFFARG